jgi:hypothetical protein
MNLSRRPSARLCRRLEDICVIDLGNGVAGIPLSDGSVAKVDRCDVAKLIPYPWFRGPSGHARTKSARANTYMHRLVLGLDVGEVDHINRDPLDNRRCNLRPATRSQNCANRLSRGSATGFRGVKPTRYGTFEACIKHGRRRHLGTFKTAAAAARAYDAAAVRIYGEFAVLNFPRAGDARLGSHDPFLTTGGCPTLSDSHFACRTPSDKRP